MQKNIRRLLPIVLNGLRSLLTPAVSIVFSYLVIRFHSKDIWGAFVDYLLFFYLATVISGWGNKDYLLRRFSEEPKAMIENWQTFFLSRLPILFLILLVVPFVFEGDASFYLIIMIAANYITNSYTPVFSYKRDYGKVILSELLGLGVLLLLLFSEKEHLTISFLVFSYASYHVVKTIFFTLLYFSYVRFKQLSFNAQLLLISLPFFLMGISGFLMSKVDLYVFGFFNTDQLLGEYQIISGFFIFSQSVATVILLPYVKNIYRIKPETIAQLKRRFILAGLFLNTFVVTVITGVLILFFDIELSLYQMITGFFIGFPAYVYGLNIYYLFRANNEIMVLKISILSLLVNLFLSLVFLYLGYGITGALFANAISQLVALVLYQMQKIDGKLLKKTE